MFNRGNVRAKIAPAQYTVEQVQSVLRACRVTIDYETSHDFVCYCPYHGNKNTPSFSVSKTTGEYICFNGACAEFGGLLELVKATQHKGDFEAMRIISKAKKNSEIDFKDQLVKALAPLVPFVELNQELLDKLKVDFWKDSPALTYMRNRGFEDSVLDEYGIGYSIKRSLVTVPMHTDAGMPIGVIGRTINEDKIFKNSKGLPTSKTLWNMHRARRTGDVVIVCEAAFDAMRISQAGYPNVVACLGGNFSSYHKEQLEKYFSTVIIMTDCDDMEKHKYAGCKKCAPLKCIGHSPGRMLGKTIAEKLQGKQILWAAYDYKIIYPHGAKDAGDMTIEEIRQCIQRVVGDFEYTNWKIPA